MFHARCTLRRSALDFVTLCPNGYLFTNYRGFSSIRSVFADGHVAKTGGRVTGILNRFYRTFRTLITVFALLIFWIIFAARSPYFLTADNLLNILFQSANLAVIATGLTFVIIAGQIDLSVGSIEALVGSAAAVFMVTHHQSPLIAIVGGLIIGISCGAVNGLLHAVFRIPTFISTLGMMSIARGLALILTAGYAVYGLPESFRFIGQGHISGVPFPVFIAAVYMVLGHIVLTRTSFGRHVMAVGGDEKAAAYAGIRIGRIKQLTMMISGFSAGIAGILMTARLNSGQGTIGETDLLDGIAAVVIGGTVLRGGAGSMWRTFLGVLTVGSLRNGLNLLGVSAFWQQVAVGVIIIFAVLVDTLQRRDPE